MPLTEGVPFDRAPEIPTESGTQAQAESAYQNKPFPTGYLGPTSFVSSLCDDVDFSSDDRGMEIITPSRVLPSFWVQKVSDVLLALADFAPIEAVIREYYGLSQASVIPGPFILNSLAPVEDMTKCLLLTRKTGESRSLLTTKVIQNTVNNFHVPSSVAGKDFHSSYTGQAIRLEILGVICSLAGRAAYLGLARNKFASEKQRLQFSKKMLVASDAALHICKILTPLNDLTIWLVQENLMFCLAADGNSSEQKPYAIVQVGSLSNNFRSPNMEQARRAIYGHLRTWPPSQFKKPSSNTRISPGIPSAYFCCSLQVG